MGLTEETLGNAARLNLTTDAQALLRCEAAKQLEELGDYEGARAAFGEFWRGVGQRPETAGLGERAAAEVLLRAGTLTGRIGSVDQIEGSQESAKNLIGESLRIFEALGDAEKVAEAQSDLGFCYCREGAFDEARVMLREALDGPCDANGEVRAVALLRSAIVEAFARRYNDALRIHAEAAPLLEKLDSHLIKGKFHNEFATLLSFLSEAEHREDYVDQALIEYAAASFHFEQAGHTRYQACVENNLGYLFSTLGRFAEAHEHLDGARALLAALKDGHVAQVDDTRARALLAEGRVAEAEKIAACAVRALERGGEQSLLAESLTTHGKALARLGRHEEALDTLRRAAEVAERAGDLEGAGQATLTLLEESGEHVPAEELTAAYERASELLSRSQNVATLRRLSACARRVLLLAYGSPVPPDWKGFSLKEAVRRYEGHLIARALKDAGGKVSRAARLLGFKHHHSLSSLIRTTHPELSRERAPVVPRRRSIIYVRAPRRTPHYRAGELTRPVSILYAEDSPVVAEAVRDVLEAEGWRVDHCSDGNSALDRIAGDALYDVLLLDNELPGASGVEVARRARKLPSRRRTPIIMLSATDGHAEARDAGVDVFLVKPDGVSHVVDTITRLIGERRDGH